MPKDYIPGPDGEFRDWLVNFDTLLTAAPATYGLVAGDAAAVAAKTAAYVAAYSLAIDPATRTAGTVAAKDTARVDAEQTVRPYAVSISLNEGVTDQAKADIGVTIRKLVPTPIPAPASAPILGVTAQTTGVVNMTYRDNSLPAGKAKPPGCVGMEVRQTIGVAPAVDPEAARTVAIFTKSPFRLTFAAADKGKTVTVFARWITRSGPGGVAQSGPWAAPVDTIIT